MSDLQRQYDDLFRQAQEDPELIRVCADADRVRRQVAELQPVTDAYEAYLRAQWRVVTVTTTSTR